MIQKQTKLKAADNSGALKLQCIHVCGGTGAVFAYLGDVIVCAVKKAIPGAAIKSGDVVSAVVVRTRKAFRREDGSYIQFSDNAVVVLGLNTSDKKASKIMRDDRDKYLAATRVFGPVAREVRAKGFLKLASLAPEVL